MFGNISQLLEMKQKTEEIKARLDTLEITETTGGIAVTCTASKQIRHISIPDTLLGDKEALEEIVSVAVNRPWKQQEKKRKKK